MTKRIMALLMAASMAMSCALLVSCGDSTTKAPETNTPTQATSGTPSETPSETPTGTPTVTPSDTPTVTPSDTPTVTPETPTVTPSDSPNIPEKMPDQETRLAKPDEFVNWLNNNDEASAKEYETSLYGPASTGGFEIWGSNFHQCILFPTVIAPVATGVGTEDYKYRFEVYYKLYDGEDSYKAAPVDVWSIYVGDGWDNYILRVHTYSCGITDLAAKSAEEPNFYDYILCTYEIDEEGEESLVCWFNLLLEISSEYEAVLQKALADDAIVK